jgi:RNA polymerase sigma-70 factor (ECF subfamily)
MKETFLRSFDEYGDAIFRFCVVKTSDPILAEDLTQETFMRYWQALQAGKEMINTRSLLYTIANNLVIDWYRKAKPVSLDARMDEGLEPRAHDTMYADTYAQYQEVLRTMDGLDDVDKQVLLLRHVEGLGPKDIAEIVGESANVVSVRLNRATKRLQQQLRV